MMATLLIPTPVSNISETVDLNITVDRVSKAISSLKSPVFNTPEQIPALFLRKTATSLALLLSLLFNMSILRKKVPQI